MSCVSVSICSFFLFSIFTLSAADVAPYYTDQSFLLWCGGLTCKEIERNHVTGVTPRQFLGIDETGLEKGTFYVPKDRLIDQDTVLSDEKIIVDKSANIRDRRLGRHWRRLDDGEKKLQVQREDLRYNFDSDGRFHVNHFISPSCCWDGDCNQGELVELYPNSVPVAGGYYLFPGTCTHKDGYLWVNTVPLDIEFAKAEKAEQFPVLIMWAEPCKKPILLHECMLPGKSYDIVQSTIAIKFIEDDAKFQIYYDASNKVLEKSHVQRVNAQVTVETYAERRELPSLQVVTYTLNRMSKHITHIALTTLSHWYQMYQDFKNQSLTTAQLLAIKDEVRSTIDKLEL